MQFQKTTVTESGNSSGSEFVPTETSPSDLSDQESPKKKKKEKRPHNVENEFET